MKKYDVVLLTESRYLNPKNPDAYSQNILLEDRLIQEELEALSLKCHREDWARPDFDWSQTRFALFRTTWDYFHRFDEFSVWLNHASKKTTLINSLNQIQWNMDKHYLRDLESKGVNTVETFFIEAGETKSLDQIYQKLGWDECVLKPAVSGAGRHTYRLSQKTIKDHLAVFSKLIKKESMLLQPFQKDVMERGEISLMLFAGKYSHAVIKIAKPGDFRVQDDFGGSVEPYQASSEEISLAEEAFAACESTPVYGRADIIRDNDKQLAITELELIEPELWLRVERKAAKKFANAVAQKIL